MDKKKSYFILALSILAEQIGTACHSDHRLSLLQTKNHPDRRVRPSADRHQYCHTESLWITASNPSSGGGFHRNKG